MSVVRLRAKGPAGWRDGHAEKGASRPAWRNAEDCPQGDMGFRVVGFTLQCTGNAGK